MEILYLTNHKEVLAMLKSQRAGDCLTVQMRGELDHYCTQSVRRELDALLQDETVRCLVLDFEDLTFMDSSGIGVILGRYRILRDRGGKLMVARMNPHIARIFHMSGMDRIIPQVEEVRV